MSRRVRKILLWSGGIVLGLIVIVAALLWYGLNGEGAAKKIIAFGLSRSGGSVKIGDVSGRLRGPLTLRNIVVATPALHATVDSAVLEWTPTGLIRRRVQLDRLLIDGVHIVLPDSAPRSTSQPKRPSLPLEVILGDVRATHISVDAPGDVRVRDGTVRLTGRAEEYRIVADASVSAPALTDAVPLRIAGRGNLERILLDRGTVSLLDGKIAARGRISWYPAIGWNLGIAAGALRPSLLLADPSAWPGTVSAWVRTSGAIDSIGPVGAVAIDSLGGTIRGEPLSGTADARFAGTTYDIRALDARWGSAHFVASGRVADTIAVRYQATIGNLAMVMPAAGGALDVSGTAEGPRTTPRVRAHAEGSNLRYAANRLRRVEGVANVDLAPGGNLTVDLRAEGATLGSQPVDRATLSLRGTRERHRLTLSARAPAGRLGLVADGGLRGQAWSGRLATLALDSTGAGSFRLERPVAISASAAATTVGELCLHSEHAATARLCASGRWRGPEEWRASSVLEHLPLAFIDSLLPDSVYGTDHGLSGELNGRLDATATRAGIDGTLHIGADSAALYYREPADTAPKRLVLDSAFIDARAGRDGIHATLGIRASRPDSGPVGHLSGTIALPAYTRLGQPLKAQPVAARLDGSIPNLGFMRPFTSADSLGGSLTLALTAGGTVGAPRLDGTLGLADFMIWLPGGRAGRGSVDAKLVSTIRQDRAITAELSVVPRGVIYDYTLDLIPRRVVVDSGGLHVVAGADGVHGTFSLGLSDSTGARLASFTATLALPRYTALGLPLATQPVSFRFDGEIPGLGFLRAVTPSVDSLSGRLTTTLQAEGTVAAPRVTGAVRLADLRAHLLQGSTVSGSIDADLTAAVATDSSITGELRVAPRDFALTHTENGVEHRVTLDSTALALQIGHIGFHGTLDARFDESGRQLGVIRGSMALPGLTRLGQPMDPQPLTARLDGRIDDLAFAQAFSSQVDSLAGRLVLDAGVTGTLGAPNVTGGLKLEDGAARLPVLGALFHDIQLSATGNQAGTFTIDGHLASGPGQLTVTGQSPLVPTAARPGHIALKGERFEVINTDKAHVIVTPDLDVTIAGNLVTVNGQVTVPLAHVELAEIPEFAVPPSDDVIFTDTLGGTRAAAYAIAANIRVILGDSISFQGFNFTASLGGNLAVTSQPDRPARGNGTIVIKEGHYKAYGQDLTISQGLIRFVDSPVDDPALAIRATRTAEDSVVAGMDIRGTLKAPQVTIFSEPAMSQNRALEYIVLGHPLGESTGGPQGSLMSKAVSSVGLRGGNLLAKTLGKGIGLDEARIETKGDLQQASFVAGRYLSPNLYVSYGIGLFDPISTLRLRYVISRHFTLQAEVGEATGADILYKVERGPPDSMPPKAGNAPPSP